MPGFADKIRQTVAAERKGSKVVARHHFDRAAELGRENALAHHERGLFYFSPVSYDRAAQAWQRYLDLGPSGPRSVRVRKLLRQM